MQHTSQIIAGEQVLEADRGSRHNFLSQRQTVNVRKSLVVLPLWKQSTDVKKQDFNILTKHCFYGESVKNTLNALCS